MRNAGLKNNLTPSGKVVFEAGIFYPRGSSKPRYAQLLRTIGLLLKQPSRTEKTGRAYAELLILLPNHLTPLCHQRRERTTCNRIQRRVLMEAQRLLIHSEQPVKRIAQKLGFRDAS